MQNNGQLIVVVGPSGSGKDTLLKKVIKKIPNSILVKRYITRKKDIKNEDFRGIRIIAKGFPSEYFVHIRTKFLLLPWQYYKGKFEVSEQWQKYEILFNYYKKILFLVLVFS